jgi:hypothetical protein
MRERCDRPGQKAEGLNYCSALGLRNSFDTFLTLTMDADEMEDRKPQFRTMRP